MKTIYVCKTCGNHIVDNDEKHRTRNKLCNKCKTPYKFVGIHFSINLDWLRQKVDALRWRTQAKEIAYFGRAKHALNLDYEAGKIKHAPTVDDIKARAKQMMYSDADYNKRKQLK
jgi:DNA-directed RNA polymerase subunit RPC12/RpoP